MKQVFRTTPLQHLLSEALSGFFVAGIPADAVLHAVFRKHKVRDVKIRAELATRFYDIIRWWRPLCSATGMNEQDAVNEPGVFISALKKWKKVYAREPVDASTDHLMSKMKKYLSVRRIRESVPDWLDEFAVKQLGEEQWERISTLLNTEPPVFLRVNTLRCTSADLSTVLQKEGIAVKQYPGYPDALELDRYHNVFETGAFHDGMFEVQDISSQKVSAFLDVHPGMRVCDACAGNGGKTLHLAALMKNKGKIIATDVSEKKLEELRRRCTRSGVDLVETRHSGAERMMQRMENSFDRVLLDVPCSGSGVLRRNPDIRWRLQQDDLTQLIALQAKLPEQYHHLVKPGGKMVFSSCSIFPCEGEMQVKSFLEAHPDEWKMEKEARIDPCEDNGDGFYMALLQKKGLNSSS